MPHAQLLEHDLACAVLDAEPSGVCVLRADDLVCAYANPRFRALFPGAVPGATVDDIWRESASDRLGDLRGVADSGEPWTGPDITRALGLGDDGAPRTVRASQEARLVETGSGAWIVCHAVESARASAAEARLRGTQRLVEQVLCSITDGFMALDRDGSITYVNDRVVRLLGLSRAELVGRSVWELVPDALMAEMRGRAERVMREGVPVSFDTHWEDGPWIEVRAYPSQDGLVAFLADVTARVEAERGRASELAGLRLLQDISIAATSSLSLEEIASRVLGCIDARLGLHAGSIYVIDDGARRLRHLALFGYPRELVPSIAELPLDASTNIGRVIAEGRDILTHEHGDDPPASRERLAAMGGAERLRWIALPVHARGKILGVLALFFEGRRPFRDEETDLYRSIAEQLGIAMENARLLESALAYQRRAGEELAFSNTLLQVSDVLTSSLDLDDVLRAIVRTMRYAMRRDRVVILAEHEPGVSLVSLVATDGVPVRLGTVMPYATLSPRTREALTSCSCTVVDYEAHHGSASPDPGQDASAERPETRLVLYVPMRRHGELAGWMSVDQPGGREPFSERDILLAEAIASQAAVALENARLFEAERERAGLNEALGEIDVLVHSSRDWDEIMQAVAQTARGAMDCDSTAIVVREPGVWWPRYIDGLPPELAASRILDERFPFAMQAEQTRDLVLTEDLAHDPWFAGEYERYGIESALAAPLVIGERFIGIVAFHYHAQPRTFTPAQRDFARRIAGSISLALENAELFSVLDETACLSAALNEIDAEINATLELGRILSRTIEKAARVLDAETAVVTMLQRDEWVVTHEYGSGDRVLGMRYRHDEVPHARLALEQRATVAIDDAASDPRVNGYVAEALGVRSAMVVPLQRGSEVFGALSFNHTREARPFSAAQVDFATKLGAHVSLAVQNATLYETEHHVAETLQEALLALPLTLDGIEFAHAYHSAGVTARVGGDFYDLFELEHGLLGIVIGDVSGKGLDAAVVTSLVKNTLRAHATDKDMTPAAIVGKVNELLVRETAPETFVTLFLGILDRRDGRLVYCNAGHTSPAIVRDDGNVTLVPATSPIAGAFANLDFAQQQAFLEPGDLLFLYTDGLTEARRDRDFFGEARVVDALDGGRVRSADETVRKVVRAMHRFSRRTLRDDMAILAVRWSGQLGGPVQQKLRLG